MLINILTIYTTLVNESVVDAATALLLYYQIKQRKNLIMICRFVLAPIMAIDAAGNSFVKSVLIRSFLINYLMYIQRSTLWRPKISFALKYYCFIH